MAKHFSAYIAFVILALRVLAKLIQDFLGE